MTIILKKISFLSFLLILPLFLVMCELVHQDEPREPNRVDAITSATKMDSIPLRIDSGFVYDTFAILHLYSNDSFDEHYVGYGLDSASIIDSISVPNWTLNNTKICTLTNLQPYTTYTVFYGSHLSWNAINENHSIWGKFTTTKLSSHF